MLPLISHNDLGHPAIAGEYDFNGASVQVDRFHIAAWSAAPDVRFNAILRTRIGDEVLRFALGQSPTGAV